MECRELTALVLDGKLDDVFDRADGSPEAVREEVSRHVADCAACRVELARIEETWSRLGEDPDAAVTPDFRRRSLALLEDEMLRSRIREFQPRRRIARGWLEAAAVVVAAAGGFWAARQAAPDSGGPKTGPFRGAAPQVSLQSLESASSLSNVSYKPADAQGRIGVSFDVTSRKDVVGRPDDPEMAKIVAFLVSRGAQTSGEKSRAIELVSSSYGTPSGAAPASPDIVRALTTTLKKDQNPGVRKKAADALAGFKMTPEIRTALLEALTTDRNPGVRLVAVDALARAAKESPDPKTIESLRQKAFDPAENGFVRSRAASALKGIEF
jgi:hypothetical protein